MKTSESFINLITIILLVISPIGIGFAVHLLYMLFSDQKKNKEEIKRLDNEIKRTDMLLKKIYERKGKLSKDDET